MDVNNRLVFTTKKSIYDPIEIEIDEKVYQSVKLTRAVVQEMARIENIFRKRFTRESFDDAHYFPHLLTTTQTFPQQCH